jgi:hypothetical protein
MNPVLFGTYSHIRIRVQQRLLDGTYYDVNDHYVWHMVKSYLAPPAPTTTGVYNFLHQQDLLSNLVGNISMEVDIGGATASTNL